MAAKLPTAQPANADFFGLLPGVPFTTATLSGNHTNSVTTITLTATVPTDWPTAGAVYIDNECITYTGKSGADLTGATRGAQGTTAAAHTDQATVRCGLTKGTVNQLIEELIQLSKTGAGAKGADVASAATLNIGEDGHFFDVTGTTTITAIETRLAGQVVHLQFDGACQITHNATSLILQGGTNVTTAAGDVFSFISEGSGNWRELSRRLASDKCCRVYRTTNQTLNDGVDTAISFDAERYDTDSMHEGVTNPTRITFTTAGVYVVTGHARFANNGTGQRKISIRLNGTTKIAFADLHSPSSTEIVVLSVATTYKFAANDYVELIAFQNRGGTLDVEAGGDYSPEFSAAKVATG